MKLLIDENLPKRLKQDFSKHQIYTVNDMGWNRKKNRELLKLMLNKKFEVLLTFDKNLQYQQNFKKYPISVLVLNVEDNTYSTLKPIIPLIHELLNGELKAGPTEVTTRI